MKSIKLSLIAAVVASSLSADAISVSGDMSFTSNALWRGTTATANSATVQGTLNVEHESGVYAGLWGTGLTTGSEIDLFVGYATEISGLNIDAGYVNYSTTGVDNNNDDYKHTFSDYGEVYLALSYDVGVELGTALYKGVMSEDKDSTIIELSANKDFDILYVGATYGAQLDEDSGDNYYSATIGKSIEAVKGDISFTYANTDADNSDAVYSLTYTTSF